MRPGARVYVAGHRGMVGSAIVRRLEREGFRDLLLRTRAELDLTDTDAVRRFFETERPEYVFLAAAHVGGILANDTYPVEFLRDNLAIELAVIPAAHEAGVRRLLFLGSSCVYPKLAPQPLREEYLLTGPLEPTNEWYAVAKIAGIKLCQAYRKQHAAEFFSVMPTNLYGPGDNFDLAKSHVLPALIRRFHDAGLAGADSVTIWGTGTPRREFLHVDDLADACVHVMREPAPDDLLNIGVGEDLTIAELAALVADVVGYRGDIRYDRTKPDGTPRKLMDVSRLHALGWRARIPLREGIEQTYAWYRQHEAGAPVPPAR
ncbi:MAG TPA: GDP-L-fucose synthase [Longimicrobiales bacterium]|nr:GDP-L-fucose synthase [Longimicrobiales bacterium]